MWGDKDRSGVKTPSFPHLFGPAKAVPSLQNPLRLDSSDTTENPPSNFSYLRHAAPTARAPRYSGRALTQSLRLHQAVFGVAEAGPLQSCDIIGHA